MFRRRKRYGYRRRRKSYRRGTRRTFRRSRRFPRTKRSLIHIRRAGSAASVSVNPAGTVYINSTYFQLNSVINPTELTALFDEYRINCVVLSFIPRPNVVQVLANGNEVPNNYVPTFHYAIDYDDANLVSNVDQLAEYGNYHFTEFNKKINVKIKPKFATAAYSGAFTSYKPGKGWLDCASPGIQHYGLKFAVDTTFPNQYISFVIRPIYYLSFRMTR